MPVWQSQAIDHDFSAFQIMPQDDAASQRRRRLPNDLRIELRLFTQWSNYAELRSRVIFEYTQKFTKIHQNYAVLRSTRQGGRAPPDE